MPNFIKFLTSTLLLLTLSFTQAFSKKVLIGGSGGYLNYPNAATSLGLAPGDTIGIKSGLYTGFKFANIIGTPSKRIVIMNEKGPVEFVGSQSYLENVS